MNLYNHMVGTLSEKSTSCSRYKPGRAMNRHVYYTKFAKDHFYYSALLLCICNQYGN